MSDNLNKVEEAISEMFKTGLTIRQTEATELPKELDTWVIVNGKKFIIHLDRRALTTLINNEKIAELNNVLNIYYDGWKYDPPNQSLKSVVQDHIATLKKGSEL